MSRNGSGVYSLPAGSLVADGDTSAASQHNTPLQDLETDMNTARPIVAGGTGATTAANARTNLEVPKSVYDTPASGYRVIGTTLECWGSGTSDASGNLSITFPKTFNANPIFTATGTANTGAAVIDVVGITALSTTAATLRAKRTDASTVSNVSIFIRWYAIGEWDGVS